MSSVDAADEAYQAMLESRNSKLNLLIGMQSQFASFDFEQKISTHIISFPAMHQLRLAADDLLRKLSQATLIDPVTIIAHDILQLAQRFTSMEKDVLGTADQLGMRVALQRLDAGIRMVAEYLGERE
ncbi:hypothetical protein SS50377_21370 [Spironucleus salmonicida]|uniref:Uncharacterized protein n=1 Tax=Spironucleus salmonicida TaxID=348837 RepID=V6LI29_9EUKA|nr:hypothetical protein SS50377_21364 [Spironucleus salmonicida]KAH0575842.1 hypothetical protein SS50377_21370 [Spironucleus salmonicida]|eukprot:EST44216.1 Hypothetical protein SS50377_15939 [Spironucleus salmonicida]